MALKPVTARIPRFYLPQALNAQMVVDIPKQIAHHMRVLRLCEGETVQLFNGLSTAWQGIIVELNPSNARVVLDRCADENPALELPYSIIIAQSLIEPSKMDWVVEKSVELGASCLQPIAASRSVTRLDADRALKRVAHWQGISVAATEQSGRNRVMHVAMPMSLPIVLKNTLNTPNTHTHTHLLLHPEGGMPLHTWCASHAPHAVTVWIGPEGGWSNEELNQLEVGGAQRITFGARVLRTETAALAISAAIQALWA